MKKVFAIILSLLLIVTFIFMALPGSLRQLMVQIKERDGGLKFSSPSYNDDIAFYYEYFLMETMEPLSLMESDLKRLLEERYDGKDVQIELNILETELKDLTIRPKFHHELFEPAYENAELLKIQLVDILDYSQLNLHRLQSEEVSMEIRNLFTAFDEAGEAFREVVLELLTVNNITFYIEDDGSITIYE